MSLKNNILEQIKNDKNLHRTMEDFHDKSFYTIETWIKTNNPMLSNYDSLQIISQALNIPLEDLMETKKEEAL